MFLKTTARFAAVLLTLPAAVSFRLSAMIFGPNFAFQFWTQLLALLPGYIGIYLRSGAYFWILPEFGRDSHVGFGTVFSHSTCRLGERVYIGLSCVVGDVSISDDVLIGSNVSIMNGCRQHGIERLDLPINKQPGEWPRIKIGKDSWIGDRSIIMADVGNHCVVGAGSVVTRKVPDYAIVAGTPARVIRFRNQPACDDSARSASGSFAAMNRADDA
jgi:virginiamycin A acetyltransferase